MKKLASLLLLLTGLAYAEPPGYYIRSDCASIVAPIAQSAICQQTTTASGRTAGREYIWSGAAWVDRVVFPSDPTNCSAGNYPLGIDANGNVQSCTPALGAGTVTSVATTAPIQGGPITTTGTITCDVASGSQPGCLSSADWTTFNNKQTSLTTGALSATAPIALSASRSVIGGAADISCAVASGSQPGCLSSADWTTFNNKGSGTILGSIAADQVAVGTAANTIGGNAGFKWTTSGYSQIILDDAAGSEIGFSVGGNRKWTNGADSNYYIFNTPLNSSALNFDVTDNNLILWGGDQATQTLTAWLSGATDPVLTFGNNNVDITTGTLSVQALTASKCLRTDASKVISSTAGDCTTGTVTSIATTSPISGGTITSTGTISIADAVADGSTKGAASFAAADFDSSSGNISLDSTLKTNLRSAAKSINIISPTTGNTNQVQLYYAKAVTLTRVACSTDTGTVTIQLDERAEATPNTAGTDVLSGTLACDNDTQVTTSFANATIAADVPLNLQITATASSPTVVRIHIDSTID